MNRTIFTKTALIIVLSILSAVFCFGSQRTIQIDQNARRLVAPVACAYQWYHNGTLMEGENNQSVSVRDGGTYEVESVDEQGRPSETSITVAINATGAIIKIILIGDSTVAPAAEGWYPVMGWGHVFHHFFNSANIKVMNFAKGGTSSKSFYGRTDGWKAAQKEIASGDYVFIQFGHNDQKDASLPPYGAYQEYLTRYVNETKAKGGYPVLVTSVNRNLWNGTTLNTGSLGEYPAAVRQLGTKLKVPVIDLHAKSAALFTKLGQAYLADYVFNNLAPGEYPAYPNGNTDKTHFREMGAIEVSRLVVEGVTDLSANASMKALASYLVPVYEVKVTANPSSAATMTTRTASYPKGITITLKTTPKSPNKFFNWNNEASSSVSKNLMYSFKMEGKATSYEAMYKNTVLGLSEENEEVEQESTLYPNPFTHDFQFGFPGSFQYTLFTMEGVEIERGNAENAITLGGHLNPGVYMLKIGTAKGNSLFKLIKSE